MKQILCLSSAPWRSIPSRSQQLMTRMKGIQVLFFEPAAGRRDMRWRQPGRRVRPEVTVYTLPPVITKDEWYGPLFRLGRRHLCRFIGQCMERHRFHEPLLWTTSPIHVHLLDHLSYSGLVYDCGADWSSMPGAWEGTLAQAADVVFAASPELMDRLSPCSGNIALLPNGVNYELFCRGGSGAAELLPQVRGPVLVWTGSIHADLDLSPVEYAAGARPEWTFVLVGRVAGGNRWAGRLQGRPNVVFPGARPLVELPDWLGRGQVCLNFLREKLPYSDVIPSRIYEYLSTGKPIVSMLWPDQVEQFPDVIYGADSPYSFVNLCQRAMREDRTWVSDRRRSYGAQAAWSGRAEEVLRILGTAGLL